ncbi:hypothetical protein QR680_007994 [Steinernema hermaphroditum]|uniref:UPAR/Ly6 domain-containing protein n=1 Tax=Steinernema hermaphroditum TaxID=289476 RepID=A0AA39IEX4_9BILA|nr:hypothetical protein QR680_007994 [Steinernema hermaphroditum]
MLLLVLPILLVSPLALAGIGGNTCTKVVYLTKDVYNHYSQKGYHFKYYVGTENCGDTVFNKHPCITVAYDDGSVIAGCANVLGFLQNLYDQGVCKGNKPTTDISFTVTCCKEFFSRGCNSDASVGIPSQTTCPATVYLDGEFTNELTEASYSMFNKSTNLETCDWPWQQCYELTAGSNVLLGCPNTYPMNQFTITDDDCDNTPRDYLVSDLVFDFHCCQYGGCQLPDPVPHERTCNYEINLNTTVLAALAKEGISVSNAKAREVNCTGVADRCIDLLLGDNVIKGCSSDPVLEMVSSACQLQKEDSCRTLPDDFMGNSPVLCCCDSDLCNDWKSKSCYREISLSKELKKIDSSFDLSEISRKKEKCGFPNDKCVTLKATDGTLVNGCSSDTPILQKVSPSCPKLDNETLSVTYNLYYGYGDQVNFTMNCCSTDLCNTEGTSGSSHLHLSLGVLVLLITRWILQ